MRCRTARRRLLERDTSTPGPAGSDRPLRRHLDRCADCRAVAEAAARIAELDPLPAVAPPLDVVESTLRRMRVARAQRMSTAAAPSIPRYLPRVAAALGILAVVGLVVVPRLRRADEQPAAAMDTVDPAVQLQAELAGVEADMLMLDLSFDQLLAENDLAEDPLEIAVSAAEAPPIERALAEIDLEISESDLDAMESIFDELAG